MRHCSRHQSLRVSGPASRPEMHFPTEGEGLLTTTTWLRAVATMRVRRRDWLTDGDTSNRELFLALWVVQHRTPYHRVPPWQSFQEKRDVGPITDSQTIDDVCV
jgi:hypothetical protein